MTTSFFIWLAAGLSAYLLGAIPFGLWIAKTRGVDIRRVGSGNIGATNVFRSVSRPLGILTFLLDFGKGVAGCTLVPAAAVCWAGLPAAEMPLRVCCGALTVVGHNWPAYLGFRGGKGIAASAGLLLGLAPQACGVAVAVWAVALLVLRYVSLASVLAALSLGTIVWFHPFDRGQGVWFSAILSLLAMIAVWRHRNNLRRLVQGTEPRIQFRKQKQG